MDRKTISLGKLQQHIGEIIRDLGGDEDVIYIMEHGRPAAVLLEYERYETMLVRLEDAADLSSLEAAAGELHRDYDAFLDEARLS